MPMEPSREPVFVPARVLSLAAAAVGVELSPRVAVEAVAVAHATELDWAEALRRVARRAGLDAVPCSIEGEAELQRLRELGMVALARVGERWLLLRGARGPLLELTIVDELGEHERSMRPLALLDYLATHTSAALPIRALVVEPHSPLGSIAEIASPLRRLMALARLERADLGVVLVQALAIGAASLAVPIAVQALVSSVATSAMLQPLVVLGAMLAVVLSFVAALRISQAIVVERIQQRLFARVAIDFARRLPRLHTRARCKGHAPELANRFFEVVALQKSAAALLIEGSALVLQIGVGLLLLAFYHPLLLAFDLVLVLGIIAVLLSGRGAVSSSLAESTRKYAVAAWLEDVAGAPLRFADARARSFADERTELLVHEWLLARQRHFAKLLRQLVGGIGLQVIASVGLLALGGWLVIARQLTLGQLVAAELVVALIGAGLGNLGKHLEKLYDAATATAKLGKLVDLPLELDAGELLPASERPIAVELSVGDAMGDGPEPITLEPGARVGLAGHSVAHARLLDALYGRGETEHVAVRLDGRELHRVEPESLRAQVALVRGAELVGGSILDNLDGRAGVNVDETLGRLLDRVGLRELSSSLPEGLVTHIHPDGAPLGHTIARRVALVRAMLAEPRLLLLDGGLDGLGLPSTKRHALLDWLFDRARPWTLVVATDDPDLLARCDVQLRLHED
jgi:putative ABC transport system ATP-binding protein